MNTQKMSDTEPRYVLHIAPLNRWERAVADGQGDYIDPSLEAERFIHGSTHEQVLIPANERFAGRDDLVLLLIDLELVPARTLFEDCYETGQPFPHIYGPIPLAAVVKVIPFPCHTNGTFSLPKILHER